MSHKASDYQRGDWAWIQGVKTYRLEATKTSAVDYSRSFFRGETFRGMRPAAPPRKEALSAGSRRSSTTNEVVTEHACNSSVLC